MEIDLRHLMRAARRWAWLVVVITLLAGMAAYVVSSRQTPMYSTTAQIVVNPGQATSPTEFAQLQASRGQAETYRLLMTSSPVLDRVIETLDLPYGKSVLSSKVTTTVIRDTQLVEIEVSDPSPEQAALIANTLTGIFVDHVEELTVSRYKQNLSEIQGQMTDLETRRTEIDTQLASLETAANANDTTIQRQVSELKDERTRIAQTLADLDSSVRSLNRAIATTTAPVGVADPAEAPTVPYAPRVMFTTLLGVFLGFLVGVGLVVLLEILDNTVKPEDDMGELTGSPLLSSIVNVPKLASGRDALYAVSHPRSNATEAIRLLRTNLEFAGATSPIRSLAMSSAGPDEGKSTILANLGVVLAQAGLKTVVIDADLRKPSQHELFGIDNRAGLTTLLTHPDQSWTQFATEGPVPGLHILPSGPLPPNPADLLSSDRFAELLTRVTQDADIVLVDTSPILAVSDALAVASHTDGVVLVARPGHTKSELLQIAAQSLHQGGMRVVGVVFNRVQKTPVTSYYGAEYASALSSSSDVPAEKKRTQPA